MSPSRFAGWEPRETTSHTYTDGLLVESVTVRESEWSDIDRMLIRALLAYRADLHSCGHPLSETALPLPAGEKWVAQYTICRACDAMEKAQEKQRKADKPALDQGKHPEAARAWFVAHMTPEQIKALQQQHADRERATAERAQALARFQQQT